MSAERRTDWSDYYEACQVAATGQGLDPISVILTEAGIPWELLQTGGFCMVIHVPCDDPRFYIWLTEAEGPAMIGLYEADADHSEPVDIVGDFENPPEDGYLYVPLNRLADTVNELRNR